MKRVYERISIPVNNTTTRRTTYKVDSGKVVEIGFYHDLGYRGEIESWYTPEGEYKGGQSVLYGDWEEYTKAEYKELLEHYQLKEVIL